jgi:alanyl-tRNA synthetase
MLHFQLRFCRYPFKIISESSISAGTRRIEAVAGRAAVSWYERRSVSVNNLSRVLSCAPDSVFDRVEKLLEAARLSEARTSQLEIIAAVAQVDRRPKHLFVRGSKKLCVIMPLSSDADLLGNKALKSAVEAIRNRENADVIMLLPNGITMVATVPDSSANELLASVLHCNSAPEESKRIGSLHFAQGKIKDAKWNSLLQQHPDQLAIKLNFI